MSYIETDPVKQLSLLLFDLKQTAAAMDKRLVRIESRLTQLMMFQGMQTDGRIEIYNRKETRHANSY